MKKVDIPIRQVIYPKDIMIYNGKSRQAAYRLLERVKKKLNKSRDEWVTISEFCRLKKIDEELMMAIVKARG